MPRVKFEPTAPACDKAKAVHVLGRAINVICRCLFITSDNFRMTLYSYIVSI
jgi:hypothetical protein